MMKRFIDRIYTDGACYPNPRGPGGWGVSCRCRLLGNGEGSELIDWHEDGGHLSSATNNRMELTAVYAGLKIAKQSHGYLSGLPSLPQACRSPIVIYSDSKYAVNSINKWMDGWARRGWVRYGADRQEIANKDIFRKIYPVWRQLQSGPTEVHLRWLKGHSGHAGNERADAIAVAMRKSQDYWSAFYLLGMTQQPWIDLMERHEPAKRVESF